MANGRIETISERCVNERCSLIDQRPYIVGVVALHVSILRGPMQRTQPIAAATLAIIRFEFENHDPMQHRKTTKRVLT